VSALLTPADAADRLGVSRQTLARWEKQGILERDPSSARPRFRSADVDALAERRASTPASRDVLLRAAADLLREHGVDGCTLEAVAERAGLTRAGVVHHHPTKEHLMEALARRFLDEFEQAWTAQAELAEDAPGRLSRAYVAVTLRPAVDGLGAAVLACATDVRRVRDVVGQTLRAWYARLAEEDLEDGLDGAGLRSCLAADGLWLLGLLHVPPLTTRSMWEAFPGAGR